MPLTSQSVELLAPRDCTSECTVSVSSAQARVVSMLDNSTETYWQSAANDNVAEYHRKAAVHWVRLEFYRENEKRRQQADVDKERKQEEKKEADKRPKNDEDEENGDGDEEEEEKPPKAEDEVKEVKEVVVEPAKEEPLKGAPAAVGAGEGKEAKEAKPAGEYPSISEVCWALDGERDADQMPQAVVVSAGFDVGALEEIGTFEIPADFSGWFAFPASALTAGEKVRPSADGSLRVKHLQFTIKSCFGQGYEARIRQLKVFASAPSVAVVLDDMNQVMERLHSRALQVFRGLVGKCFFALPAVRPEKSEAESKDKDKDKEKEKEKDKEEKEGAAKKEDGREPALPEPDAKVEESMPKQAPSLGRQESADLQQQVVGLLFNEKGKSELTDLQRLVCELIFAELQREVDELQAQGKVLDNLPQDSQGTNAAVLLSEEEKERELKRRAESVSDLYCYELVSMVASLSVSETGARFLASPPFINTLLSLLVPGTPRVQRALIRVLRRILPRMSSEKLTVRYQDTVHSRRDYSNPVLFFLFCIASSLKAHMRGNDKGVKLQCDLSLSGFKRAFDGAEARALVALLRTLYRTPKWEAPIAAAVQGVVGQIRNLAAAASPQRDHSEFWLAVAALCFLGGDGEQPSLLPWFPGLVAAADKSLSVDAHDGNCRAKVLNEDGSARIIVVGDLAHSQAIAEFRRPANTAGAVCRFCSTPLSESNTAVDAPCETLVNVCSDPNCVANRDTACRKVLPCSHPCGGVLDEKECLPCLHPDCAVKQDADSLCSVCYTDNLAGAPSVELKCGHFFHYGCVRRQLAQRWNGPRITFGFSVCTLCRKSVVHPMLADVTDPIEKLRDDVEKKALLRLKYEGLDKHPEITSKGSRWFNDPMGFAMHKFAYYMCFKCQRPYYGGNYECAAAADHGFDPSELLCGACSPIQAQDCPKHGKDYLEFKCRFCCSVAIWFCFGTLSALPDRTDTVPVLLLTDSTPNALLLVILIRTGTTHFCEPCHNNNGALCGKPKNELVQCPCKPGSSSSKLPEKLEGSCPLGVDHPPSGVSTQSHTDHRNALT